MTTPTESHLQKALKAGFTSSENLAQLHHWLDYALSTNERGRLVLNTVKQFIPSVAGKRYLDIGCGYGGSCIAFASEGAVSTGIDYDERLLNFARENHRDHPDLNVSFQRIDVMDWKQVKSLGKFDIITTDNVIEHVSDPGRLIAFCRLLLNPEGLIYITAPNAYSLGQIRKDCHYSLPGISLLDPDDGAVYLKRALNLPFYDVSWYYRYATFEQLFTHFGLSVQLLNPYNIQPDDIQRLLGDYQALFENIKQFKSENKILEEIYDRIIYRMRHHIQMLETDILFESELLDPLDKAIHRNHIFRDYHTELWYFVLRPLNNEKVKLIEPDAPSELRYSALENISGRRLLKILWKKILIRLRLTHI